METPTTVPIVSKKSLRIRVKTSRTMVTTPTCWNAPNRLKEPMRPKSGAATTSPGRDGTVRPQAAGAMSAISLMTIATTVITTMLMRMAPFTLRASSATVSSTPRQKTRTGQPESCPVAPSWTGTEPVSPGMRVAKPASMKPMNAMKSPMPTLIACLRAGGMACMTASRSPVTTRTQISSPSMTIRPIASGQLISGAIWKATTALSPSPAAMASGRLPPSPMIAVITAATRAVAVTSWGPERCAPNLSSAEPRMIGLRTRM